MRRVIPASTGILTYTSLTNMPWTIYRYILKDLLKLLAISSAVLLLVIDFAAAIKPLSDGLLGPVQLMKFVFYSMPTMLSFALPFSAAFASTLVFARMAADNEILACRASGMSYGKILAPVIAMGLFITLSLMFLSNQVIPKFYMLAEQQLERDMMKVVVTQIKSGQPVKMRNMVLYADAVDDTQPPPVIENLPPGVDQPTRMVLFDGVAIALLDKQGKLKIEGTAERADALFFRSPKQSWMQVRLENVMYYRADRSKDEKPGGTKPAASPAATPTTAPSDVPAETPADSDPESSEEASPPSAARSETFGDRGQLLFVERWNPPALAMPNPFQDRLQFFTYSELLDLRANPHHFDRVNSRIENLQNSMLKARLLAKVKDALTPSGSTRGLLVMQAPVASQQYRITVPQFTLGPKGLLLKATAEKEIEVTSMVNGMVDRRMLAKAGVLEVESGDVSPEPRIHVELEDVQVLDAQSGPNRTQRKTLPLPGSTWPGALIDPGAEKPTIDALLTQVESEYAGDTSIVSAATNLKTSVMSLNKRVLARLHERFASAVSASLVLTLGALMSLFLAGRMPLVVYFWSFLVATLAVVLARAGETIAINQSLPSLGMLGMWSGNLLLALAVLVVWRKLSRN